MYRKTYILDTNVLLYDPTALENFEECEVVIPLAVIEEMDAMKRLPTDIGRNARALMRAFDKIKEKYTQTDLVRGVELENKCLIKIFSGHKNEVNGHFYLDKHSKKNHVLYAAYLIARENKNVVLISKDFATRLKAQMIGVHAEDYKRLSVSLTELYTGLQRKKMEKKESDLFLKDGMIPWQEGSIVNNEYCHMTGEDDTEILARYDFGKKSLVNLKPLPGDLWGIKPRNKQQRCAVDLLLRDDIKLVTLVGQAGTGKTLLALACALRKVFDESQYAKILVSRPIVPLGKDIGFLPGTKEEKLFHWMQPIYDNLEYLCRSNIGIQEATENLRWIKESGKLEMEAVTYIRGRTLPKMFMIIDEAQNLTPHEVKTIISRAGEGTKVILTGDPSQIDNPYLDMDGNGLTYVISKFRGHRIYGHMTFDVTERSELSSLAAEVL